MIALLFALTLGGTARAEDGYALWLRHAPLEDAPWLDRGPPSIYARNGDDPTIKVATAELERGLLKLGGKRDPWGVGTMPRSLPNTPASFELDCRGDGKPNDGRFRVAADRSNKTVKISGPGSISCLYGVYALLRELSQGEDPLAVNLDEKPAMPLRMLNHWDNPDGYVERGYSGRSIFDWWRLPDHLDQRLLDYASANASIGINGTVVNNVNASPLFLTDRYIPKLKRVADALRPYGIRLYISARFSAPHEIGGLPTADPLDPRVEAWWKERADEIYAAIPDFGGFLVKANSEGQPGPQDYGRTHADGANMMARAIGDRGTVIWRAFVYSEVDPTDRAKQAYAEFVPLDGKFAGNVIVQVKNGAIDFQPREPFHPLFGAMPKTRLMLETQLTKEYLGFATHLVFLAPMWEEVLRADTGRGGTVADVIAPVGMAGVANTGSDRNWSGSHFDQANWYAFGRLAWDPGLSSEAIAREWAAQTFSREQPFLDAVVPLMLGSRQAAVDYMTPLGLTHQMATGHHYGPGPWVADLARPEWNPMYYSRADKEGIGFDRTASGSNALSQYAPAVAAQWDEPGKTSPDYLLWFHHVTWDFAMPSGKPLWNELVGRYDAGVARVDAMAQTWASLEPYVDAQRFTDVAENLRIQQQEARWWRDASIAYWQSINGLGLPAGTRPPEHSLDYYRSLTFPEAPGN
ncbi:alpha-glucuronidase [Croceibacterium sp. LX-88]|uniref:Alpha-glucuronidase n=1 Tax=Croceibacterium selenioxidans TaxID=2838833 RepID=A0ABS5W5D1_9SPHN|nr:alpha-glucuronidase [Croceibacterium selenioxidans]MBT2134951.1 alpha-glucuronidase [Croceibacterium selenioxidans]